MNEEQQILKNMHKIEHLSGCIVQGRYDIVCPAESAWLLHKSWPKAEFKMIADAGHAVSERGITEALVDYIQRF